MSKIVDDIISNPIIPLDWSVNKDGSLVGVHEQEVIAVIEKMRDAPIECYGVQHLRCTFLSIEAAKTHAEVDFAKSEIDKENQNKVTYEELLHLVALVIMKASSNQEQLQRIKSLL